MTQQRIKELQKITAREMERVMKSPEPVYRNRRSHKIIAMSGDQSANGIGNEAKIIKITHDDFHRVQKYLNIQELYQDYVNFSCWAGSKFSNKDSAKIYDMWLESTRWMDEIFDCKYDYRTNWCWITRPDVLYRAEDHPYWPGQYDLEQEKA